MFPLPNSLINYFLIITKLSYYCCEVQTNKKGASTLALELDIKKKQAQYRPAS